MVLVENIAGCATEAVPLPDRADLWCAPLDDHLSELLIARTLDAGDTELRNMTSDLDRFSSFERLALWRRQREVVCLVDAARSLLGVLWIGSKPMPERDDYFDPELIRRCGPQLTWAIRTYGHARGHGLASAFSQCAFDMLAGDREHFQLWYQTRADNTATRSLVLGLGFTEVSGEAGGTVVGLRFGR